ncbi:MAG TPA: glycosyl hydrolase, partial [Bacteroidales bacterium]|nr:glycosyl hydrolase [Bacteroidales bacterium]
MILRRVLIVTAVLFIGLGSTVSGQAKSPKRGICGDASPQDLAVLAPSVTWYYDWGVEPPAVSQGQLSGIEWVPMCWGAVY